MNESKDKIIEVKISKTTIKINQKVNICLELSEDIGFVNEANILISMKNNKDEKQIRMKYLWTQNNVNYFTCNVDFEHIGLYYFYFQLIINGEEKWIMLDQKNNKPVIDSVNGKKWTITAYESEFEVPDWAQGKVMYHIFVDRFYRSKEYNPKEIKNRSTKKWGELPEWKIQDKEKHNNTDFFMGNLKGIEEKIPYLKKLGVKIIYLSPICESQSNHRYDVGDYEKVDTYLGENKDLKNLCVKAHRNGMKIIVDGVFNHTGNDSKYFNEYGNYNTLGAFQGKESEYFQWYKKDKDGNFEYWWGFKNLPVCNGNNPQWQEFIYGKNGIIDKWFKLGIDGLRLDVADELNDDFIKNIRNAVKRNKKDGFIIGEVWENAITKERNGIQRKYLLGQGLDTVMNYPFTNAILKYVRFGDYNFFKNTVNEILTQYPIEAVNSLMNSLSTHDISRAITTLCGDGIEESNLLIWDTKNDRKWQAENDYLEESKYNKAKHLFKIASIIQYFLPGNSCIYYGDEIGMYGYRDPFNRKCFNWSEEGNELNEFFKKLGEIKNNYVFLKDAKFEIIELNDKVMVFQRIKQDEAITVIVNRTNEKCKLNLFEKYENGEFIIQKNYQKHCIGEYGYAIIKNKS